MKLVSELRRRNVFRMAVLYMVAAWLIMQVGEVVIALAALPQWTGRAILVLLAVGFPIALIFSWFYELTPEGLSLEKDVDRAASITHVTGRRIDFVVIALLSAAVLVFAYDKWWMGPPPENSIAVLPFVNMSDDPEQEYFSDGISEELLNVLAQLPGLRVPARTSTFRFRDSREDVAGIASALNVAYVLEGSIRKAGQKLRITAQLIKADDGYHVWSDTYDREIGDVFEVQDEIAGAISDVLQVKLDLAGDEANRFIMSETAKKGTGTTGMNGRHASANRKTNSIEAHEAYLRGRYFLNQRSPHGLKNAQEQFEKAIMLDPGYALAYSGLADTYLLLSGYGILPAAEAAPKQKAAAYKALQLDEASAEANVSVGAVLAVREWDWAGAEQRLRRAIEINPNYALALQWYGSVLAIMGRPEHLATMEHAHQLDPFSLRINVDLGLAHYYNEDYEKAIQQFRKTIELDPEFRPARGALGLTLIEAGDFDNGIAEIEKGAGGTLSTWLGYALARAGRTDEALANLESWREYWEEHHAGANAVARTYAGLGQTDEAIEWLHVAIDNREMAAATLQSYIYWKPLRSDPRYPDLLRRVNLLE